MAEAKEGGQSNQRGAVIAAFSTPAALAQFKATNASQFAAATANASAIQALAAQQAQQASASSSAGSLDAEAQAQTAALETGVTDIVEVVIFCLIAWWLIKLTIKHWPAISHFIGETVRATGGLIASGARKARSEAPGARAEAGAEDVLHVLGRGAEDVKEGAKDVIEDTRAGLQDLADRL